MWVCVCVWWCGCECEFSVMCVSVSVPVSEGVCECVIVCFSVWLRAFTSHSFWTATSPLPLLRFCGSHVAHSTLSAGNIAQSEFETCYDDITFSFHCPHFFYHCQDSFPNRLSPGSLVLLIFLFPGFSFLTDSRRDHWVSTSILITKLEYKCCYKQ